MGRVFFEPKGALTQSNDLTAKTNNVMAGFTYIGNDTTDTGGSGTLTMNGDAAPGDVMANKTFYSDDPQRKQTGTLAFTGNATASAVLAGRTFYTTNPSTKHTGTAKIMIPNGISTAVSATSFTIPARCAAYVMQTKSGQGQVAPDINVPSPGVMSYVSSYYHGHYATENINYYVIFILNPSDSPITVRSSGTARILT